MTIDPGFVAFLKETVDVDELFGSILQKFRKAGVNRVALCPFHQERTPSFTIFATGGYHCFGCGVGGDIIAFYQDYYRLSFVEAVQEIARLQGIEVKYTGVRTYDTHNVNHTLRTFAKVCAGGHNQDSLGYLSDRGVTAESVEKFSLGYCGYPLWIKQQLHESGSRLEDMVQAGLLSEDTGYSLFSNRIMFPVHSRLGHVVGFGARVLSGDGAKYINSKDSDIFKKGSILYGANLIRRMEAEVYVVEGYLDVIMMSQIGLTAVAPMGTALTDEQGLQLKRYAQHIIMMFDGDVAGQAAAEKAINLTLKQGLICSIYELPEGKDPADMIKESKSTWLDRSKITSPVKFLFQRLSHITRESGMVEGFKIVEKFRGTALESYAIEEMSRVMGISVHEIRRSSQRSLERQRPQAVTYTVDSFIIAALFASVEIREKYLPRHGELLLDLDEARNVWVKMRHVGSEGSDWTQFSHIMDGVSLAFRLSVVYCSEMLNMHTLIREFRARMELLRLEKKRSGIVHRLRLDHNAKGTELMIELDNVIGLIHTEQQDLRQLDTLRGKR